jgi:hypothetical protein
MSDIKRSATQAVDFWGKTAAFAPILADLRWHVDAVATDTTVTHE